MSLKKYLSLCFEIPSFADGDLPQWLKLLPAGEMTGHDGRRFVNAFPETVLQFFTADGRDIALDIEHATEIKGPAGEPAPAQGWFNTLEIRNGEIWGKIDFNADGSKLISGKNYRYISPAFYHDAHGNILGISSVGLTNKPNLDLPALNQEQTLMKLSAAIAAALSLNAETATDVEAVTAIEQLKNDKQLALNRAANPDLAKFVPKETHDLALNRAQTAEQKLADIADAEINALVDGAIKAGKIAPANKDMYLATCRAEGGREQFEAFIKTAPVIASTESRHEKKPGADGNKLTDGELAMCRSLGLTQEQYLAAKPTTQE
ncbi:peptidase [Photobacterium sp. WH24]|uniref:phage protease n=1 Tax=Photobacterium sp. WH24 TaxID=2827237 RepID=UPI001C48AEBC|nr:phage protease [Photobacterium sp. WH24]MBV7262569.1 peptidase [Photobacterium sp. WH24]